jgi:hypothetical protein
MNFVQYTGSNNHAPLQIIKFYRTGMDGMSLDFALQFTPSKTPRGPIRAVMWRAYVHFSLQCPVRGQIEERYHQRRTRLKLARRPRFLSITRCSSGYTQEHDATVQHRATVFPARHAYFPKVQVLVRVSDPFTTSRYDYDCAPIAYT